MISNEWFKFSKFRELDISAYILKRHHNSTKSKWELKKQKSLTRTVLLYHRLYHFSTTNLFHFSSHHAHLLQNHEIDSTDVSMNHCYLIEQTFQLCRNEWIIYSWKFIFVTKYKKSTNQVNFPSKFEKFKKMRFFYDGVL